MGKNVVAGNTELTIKQGPTSALLPLEILRYPVSQLQPPRQKEHVEPVTSGFHVSLRGTFGPSSHLAIAYAAFSYMDCFTGSDFLCQNHRCIPSQLNCDGFDHCGDNSDEPATCSRDWDDEPHDKKWHTNKANYYFPKIDRYPDLKTATLVFVVSSLGLIILISALIVLLYRMGARARQQRELQSRLQTISELLDGARIDEIGTADDPPVYEAPPGYDEVVKLNLELGGRGQKKKRTMNRNRNSPSSCSYEHEQQSYTIQQHHQQQAIVMDGASSSCITPAIPIAPENTKRQYVPESPPPPYVTPPDSVIKNLVHTTPTRDADETYDASDTPLPQHVDDLENVPNETNVEEEVYTWSRTAHGRRAWFRRSCDFSRPLSRSENVQAVPVPSSSLDAEILGAYLRDYPVSCPSCTTTEHSVPQSNNCRSALTVISSDCQVERNDESAKEEEETITERVVNVLDDNSDCTCEGACGCVVNGRYLQQVKTMSTNNDAIEEQNCPIETTISTSNDNDVENANLSSSSKNAIVGFLRGSSSTQENFTSFVEVPVTSTCNNCEKFCSNVNDIITDEEKIFDVAPESPKKIFRRIRRYSSCDLDGLYESIRLLDSYLARRGKSPQGRKQSAVAVMLFGTPEHSSRRIRGVSRSAEGTICLRSRTDLRLWHSNEETLSN